VALVTGGSRGLGYLVARELLRRGARVALCARHDRDVREAVAALSAEGAVQGRACDVTDADAVQDLVHETTQRLGPIDVVVNNAGEMTVGPLAHMTRADFEQAMAVHYLGPLNVVLAVLPAMRAGGAGASPTSPRSRDWCRSRTWPPTSPASTPSSA